MRTTKSHMARLSSNSANAVVSRPIFAALVILTPLLIFAAPFKSEARLSLPGKKLAQADSGSDSLTKSSDVKSESKRDDKSASEAKKDQEKTKPESNSEAKVESANTGIDATPAHSAKSKPESKSPELDAAATKLSADLAKQCERHFPGLIQSEVRAACASSSQDFAKYGRSLVETRCRLNYGEEPRLVMSCLIGASVAEDLTNGRDEFKRKLQLCAETYPAHNEIDAFLQESCLTGTHIPELMPTEGKARFEACAQITPERSFIGPCAVGLGLALEKEDANVAPANQNRLCDLYFNSKRFHKGYRACLNARGLALDPSNRYSEALKDCANILTESNNDTEKAACMVGLAIFRHLKKKEDVAKRFQKCGDNKVTYQDRDFLACLTAASLLDFTDKGGAESGCREVFKDSKSHSRSDCLNSLTLF